MNFLIDKKTGLIAVKSTFPIEAVVKLNTGWENNSFIIKRDDISPEEMDRRKGVFYSNGKIVFGDTAPNVYYGYPIFTKRDVDLVTQERVVELFNIYGGEDKFKTELSLYNSDFLTAEKKKELGDKLKPIIEIREKIISEGNEFATKRNIT